MLENRARISFITHGCRLNQAETELLRQQCERRGYRTVPFGEPTDVAVVHTCTVTREAEAKCRQSIRKVIRNHPQAFVAVIGCYSETGAAAIAAIEGVDLIIGNQAKMRVLDYVGEGKNKQPRVIHGRIDSHDFSLSFVGEVATERRVHLKIQDGCDFRCAFCIIPLARGRARSRRFDNVMAEAERLVANGAQELVLTGVNIGTFQSQSHDFLTLIDALDGLPGLRRIRISSIEPTTVPVRLFERMRDPSHALLPYLHLPLQAGTDKILRFMHRRYSLREYLDFIETAHRDVPDLCLGTDIMVGHPGETEADFEASCQVFLDYPFAYCHVFPYSERPGAASARRCDEQRVPVQECRQRSAHLRRLSAKKRYDYYERFLGRTMEVLFEQQQPDGKVAGYTPNFIRVRYQSDQNLTNRRVAMQLERIQGDGVEGTLVVLPSTLT